MTKSICREVRSRFRISRNVLNWSHLAIRTISRDLLNCPPRNSTRHPSGHRDHLLRDPTASAALALLAHPCPLGRLRHQRRTEHQHLDRDPLKAVLRQFLPQSSGNSPIALANATSFEPGPAEEETRVRDIVPVQDGGTSTQKGTRGNKNHCVSTMTQPVVAKITHLHSALSCASCDTCCAAHVIVSHKRRCERRSGCECRCRCRYKRKYNVNWNADVHVFVKKM